MVFLPASTAFLLAFILKANGEVDPSNVRGKSDVESESARNLIDSRFAFPTVVSAYLPAPFITAGACNAGTKYHVQKVADLYNYLDQIECVFHAGLTPTTVGLGYNYGTLLLAANTAWPATVSEAVYQGDYIVRTWCKDKHLNIGVLNIGGLDVGVSNIYIGDLPGAVAEGEYWDGKPSLVADFRVNMKELCPIEGNASTIGLQGFVPFRNSIPPVNGYVDVCRVVGRDRGDGGLVLLCKAYSTSDRVGYSTVLYYGLKNFDQRVLVVGDDGKERMFAPTPDGEELLVTKDFTYSRKGVRSAIEGFPASLDVLNLQAMVAQRDAIDAVISKSIFGEIGRRAGGLTRYQEDVVDFMPDVISSSNIAQAAAGAAESVQRGIATAAEQIASQTLGGATIGQIHDGAIKSTIRTASEGVGNMAPAGLKDRLTEASNTLTGGIQAAVSGGRVDVASGDL